MIKIFVKGCEVDGINFDVGIIIMILRRGGRTNVTIVRAQLPRTIVTGVWPRVRRQPSSGQEVLEETKVKVANSHKSD